MTEAGWLQIGTSLITAMSAAFVLWLNFRYGKIQTSVESVSDKTDQVIVQNLIQDKKITDVHAEINSQLSKYIAAAVKAALSEGEARGIESERVRTEAMLTESGAHAAAALKVVADEAASALKVVADEAKRLAAEVLKIAAKKALKEL